MKNDTFFNGIAIVVPLLVAIGMFKHGLPYFWVPYLISLLFLCRYADFLELREKERSAVPFPVKKTDKQLIDTVFKHYDKSKCSKCDYVVCVCKPVVNHD